MRRYKAYVAIRGMRMTVVMLLWPRMEAEFHGVSPQTERTKTTKKQVWLLSDE